MFLQSVLNPGAVRNRFTKNRRHDANGMTLVELLAVLILLSMLATMTSIRFAAPLRQQRVQSIAQQWLSLDFVARKMSRNSDVFLRIYHETSNSIVTIERNGQKQREWSIPYPATLTVANSVAQPMDAIHFVRGQGSVDYYVSVREGTSQSDMAIAGGTGKVRHVTK